MLNKLLIVLVSTLLFNSLAFSASKNYTNLIQNIDASVFIVRPHFNLGGENRPISYASDLNGVCKLFGYKSSIDPKHPLRLPPQYDMRPDWSAVAWEGKDSKAVRIGANGRLESMLPDLAEFGDRKIALVACDASDSLKVSANTEVQTSQNDDGSYLLRNPRFGGFPISASSHLEGVCHSFGFKAVDSECLSLSSAL